MSVLCVSLRAMELDCVGVLLTVLSERLLLLQHYGLTTHTSRAMDSAQSAGL